MYVSVDKRVRESKDRNYSVFDARDSHIYMPFFQWLLTGAQPLRVLPRLGVQKSVPQRYYNYCLLKESYLYYYRGMADPLFAPNNPEFNWLEEHHQECIATWLRSQKRTGRLSFDIGMEGVRLPKSLRAKMKRQGMDAGTPDIKIKLRGGVLLHIELKAWGRTATADQKTEHALLESLGHIVHIVKEKTPYLALLRVKELVTQYEAA